MLKLFYNGADWLGFEAPEKSKYNLTDPDLKKEYDIAYAEARANALEIFNPEILKQVGYLGLKQKDGEFEWTGNYEKKVDWEYINGDKSYVIILSSLPSKETNETQDELWGSILMLSASYNFIDSETEMSYLIEKFKAKYVLTRR